MSTEQNKANFRRFIEEVWNKGNLAALDDIALPNLDLHFMPAGLEPIKRFLVSFREAFPDVSIAIEDLFAVGDRLVARLVMSGTHRGLYLTPLKTLLPATGKRFTIQIIDIWRFDANGKWAECWSGFDRLGQLQQLGAIPEAGLNPPDVGSSTLTATLQG